MASHIDNFHMDNLHIEHLHGENRHIENLLKTIMSENADYPTTQMIKNGKFCEAATSKLRKRRTALLWQKVIFFAIIGLPMLGNLIVAISNRLNGTAGTIVGLELFPLLALGLMAGIVQTQASITKLETVLTVWLLENDDRQDETTEPLVEMLHR